MIESLCLYLHCLSAALLCYTAFQNYSFIRSTSCSCSTCCFGLGFQLQNLQDFIKIFRALIKDIFLDVLAESEHREPNADVAWPEPLRPRPSAPMPVWLVTTDDQCTRAAEQAQLQAEWVVVQVRAGQPRPLGLPRGTALLVATEVPHDPHMAVHSLDDQLEGTGHLVVHQGGGPAWLKEHVTALRSWASTIAGAEIRLHDRPAVRPGDTTALSVDQLTPSRPDVQWHSADLNAGWLSPTGYYWIPEDWGHTSSDASGGGPCKQATSVALAADLTRTWAVAISGTVPDGEGVAASLPLQYGAHRPWVHTVDAEVILHLLRQADRERTTRVPAGAAKVVNQMPLPWLWDGLRARGRHAEHPFWYVRATSHHGDALLHKADWAASQDTVLQSTPPGPGHAQFIVAGYDGHLDRQPPTMRTLSEVAWRAQTDHALTHQGHTPLDAAHATASPRRPPTTGRCGPETATRRCSAGSAHVRSGSPASPSSHNRASYAAARRRPRCTCTWGAPTHGSSGPTTTRRCTRRPATSHPETEPCGWPRGAPQAPHGRRSSALGWCPRRQRRSSAPYPATTRREGPQCTVSSSTCSG